MEEITMYPVPEFPKIGKIQGVVCSLFGIIFK